MAAASAADCEAPVVATPILMLTALDAVDDRVAGLDAGADDYLAKPFDLGEEWRVCGPCCGGPSNVRPAVIQIHDLALDTASHAAARGGRSVTLTAKEYALIEFLVLNQDRVVGREQIGQHVWDENFDPLSNVIDVYIKRLRSKLDTGFSRRLIHTRRGEGLHAERATGGQR